MEDFSGMDIYLLDQILKGKFDQWDNVLDAGCGSGRNMRWFLMNQIRIEGCDISPEALSIAKERTDLPNEKLHVYSLNDLGYENDTFDKVICCAVLHFAKNTEHFFEMMNELTRVLKPNGMLLIRMTSNLGLNGDCVDLGDGRFLLNDETERFLLTMPLIEEIKNTYHLEQIEPVKSTLVENLRSMTTLVLKKKN